MKITSELRLKSRLPRHLRYEFMVQMDKKCIDRIQVISWLGVILYSLLFILDYYRYIHGYFEIAPCYRTLFYLHICGILFLFPALATTFAKAYWRRSRLTRAILIWYTILVMTLTLLGQTYCAYVLYGGLALYMIYVLVMNWTFTLNHNQRITFNTLCIIIITYLVNFVAQTTGERMLLNLFEIVFFTLIAFIFDTFEYNLRQEKFLNEKELEKEKARIEELEQLKSRMYTNLTHEFRTPLTVISGMASQILEEPRKWAEKGADLIRRNSRRILTLINQILDLNKLESGAMTLNLAHGDVVVNLRYIVDSFKSYAESRNVGLHFLTDVPDLFMDYDPERSLTVISNLLSNAIKYTPEGGNVYVFLNKGISGENEYVELRIRDTGIGIPEDQLDRIFDRFYRVQGHEVSVGAQGSGIGLALTRELVKLMHGTIEVKSDVGKGTEFVLTFQITQNTETAPARFSPKSIQAVASSWVERPEEPEYSHLMTGESIREMTRVLVIEDNADVVTYIASVLPDEEFILSVARDGGMGIEKAIEEVPDMIITDLMMPVKDGYEVCHTLKNDDRTSHIPVIMLTARADRTSRLMGLSSGADAYLVKPFDPEELVQRIRQMTELRKKLQRHFSSLDPVAADDPAVGKEDAFLTKVRTAIEAKLDDASFGIMQLCRAIGMSRTQLHNKLKALTGKSASHYIRAIRLHEAQKLLKDSDFTISEVAYATGFNDPGYFSRVYREEFGESPSEYRA